MLFDVVDLILDCLDFSLQPKQSLLKLCEFRKRIFVRLCSPISIDGEQPAIHTAVQERPNRERQSRTTEVHTLAELALLLWCKLLKAMQPIALGTAAAPAIPAGFLLR
jgi:hypothetical protein